MLIFIADQIYGDEEMHMDVRTLCMDYIVCLNILYWLFWIIFISVFYFYCSV